MLISYLIKLLQISFSCLSDDDIDASNTFTYNLAAKKGKPLAFAVNNNNTT